MSARLSCFECGAPVLKRGDDPVPICDNCRKKEHKSTDIRDVRWMVRHSEEDVAGPYNRSQVLELLGMQKLPGGTLIQRVGEEPMAVAEHEDFRGAFIEGTLEWRVVEEVKKREAKRAQVARKTAVLKVAKLVAGLVAVIGGTAVAWTLIPASVKTQAQVALGLVEVQEADIKLPGENVIAELQSVHTGLDPAQGAALLQEGTDLLWKGGFSDRSDAVRKLEQAATLLPRDAEALTALIEAYGQLLEPTSQQTSAAATLIDRVEALKPSSAIAFRAAAAAHLASGNMSQVGTLARQCIDAGGAGYQCPLYLAVAMGDGASLDALSKANPDVRAVQRAFARVAARDGRLPAALIVARKLVQADPNDVEAWGVVARGAVGVAAWEEALDASKKAARLSGSDGLDMALIEGMLLLRVYDKREAALQVFTAMEKDALFSVYGKKDEVYGNAAMAAHLLGKNDEAIAWADKALEVPGTHPQAVIGKAMALGAKGDAAELERLIERTDMSQIRGRLAAQYYLAAARILTQNERHESAQQALSSALSEDPAWPVSRIEGARLRLAMGIVPMAVEYILEVGLLDFESLRNDNPMIGVWVPSQSVADLRTDLLEAVKGDIRYDAHIEALRGILAWISGRSDARALLDKAIKGPQPGKELPEAHGALAQMLLRQGDIEGAAPHIDAVLAARTTAAAFHGFQGRVLLARGEYDEAMRAFDRAANRPDGAPAPKVWLAEAKKGRGDLQGAVAGLEDVVNKSPWDLGAQRALLAMLEGGK